MLHANAVSLTPSLINTDNRKAKPIDANNHWLLLTNAQRFAFYTLAKLGYQLLFVRNPNNCSTAVASQEDKLVTIDDEGEIDFSPNIILRETR
ncbi:MAG: hypothetical protein ACI8SJ_000488 [Shewanella sp.]|jgi:hypothetical protein